MKLVILWRVLLTLCCAVQGLVSVDTDVLQLSLEKDVLRHTVHYLRRKLLRCLHEATLARTKRKVDTQVPRTTRYNLDIDIMKHTQQYLKTRLLTCLHEVDNVMSRETALDTGRELVQGFPPSKRTTTEQAPVTSTSSPSFKLFEIDKKNVSCDSVELLEGGQVFRCRNLIVEQTLRLPNMYFCPPVYDPNFWTSVGSVTERTHQVLDIKGLCSAFTESAGYRPYVLNARVIWGCDEGNQERIKWLDGHWSGLVLDNAFARDLECTYNGVFQLTDSQQ